MPYQSGQRVKGVRGKPSELTLQVHPPQLNGIVAKAAGGQAYDEGPHRGDSLPYGLDLVHPRLSISITSPTRNQGQRHRRIARTKTRR
jgi:hypothetical protein